MPRIFQSSPAYPACVSIGMHLISIYLDEHGGCPHIVDSAVENLPQSWHTSLSRPGPEMLCPPEGVDTDALSTAATSEHFHNSTPPDLKDPI